MVGAKGFEPSTPCTPCRCATRLRYAPTRTANYRRDHRSRPSNWRIRSSSCRSSSRPGAVQLAPRWRNGAARRGGDRLPWGGRRRRGRAARRGHFGFQPVAGAVDRESLLVEEIADAADQQHLVVLVVTAVAAALDRLQLREFLLPVAEHVRLDRTKVADLADGEVPLGGDRRQFRVSGPLHTLHAAARGGGRTPSSAARRATRDCACPVRVRSPSSGAKASQCGKVPAWFAASTMAFSF